jgi:ribosomal protein S16
MPVRLRLARFGRKVNLSRAPYSLVLFPDESSIRLINGTDFLPKHCFISLNPHLPGFCMQNLPFYRIFAADSRSPRDGKHIEILGHFDPIPGDYHRAN